jgi:hypothetical protein
MWASRIQRGRIGLARSRMLRGGVAAEGWWMNECDRLRTRNEWCVISPWRDFCFLLALRGRTCRQREFSWVSAQYFILLGYNSGLLVMSCRYQNRRNWHSAVCSLRQSQVQELVAPREDHEPVSRDTVDTKINSTQEIPIATFVRVSRPDLVSRKSDVTREDSLRDCGRQNELNATAAASRLDLHVRMRSRSRAQCGLL